MNKPLYGIYGAGGCGRGILPLARMLLNRANISLDQLVFIDDDVDGRFTAVKLSLN